MPSASACQSLRRDRQAREARLASDIACVGGGFPISRTTRFFYRLLGSLCVVLGFIGLFLPLWPTTPFILVAAWAFARSSPQLHERLMSHKQFGPLLRDWHQYRAIPRRAKIITVVSMVASFIITLFLSPTLWGPLIAGAVMLMSGTYVVTRPEPPPRPAPMKGEGP